jgi:hypothetical protein
MGIITILILIRWLRQTVALSTKPTIINVNLYLKTRGSLPVVAGAVGESLITEASSSKKA